MRLLAYHQCCSCFNPRARDGREIAAGADYNTQRVSIHAPVMDANDSGHASAMDVIVSIHAPVMDAKLVTPEYRGNSSVSIHAPVMDANGCVLLGAFPVLCFNPRARDGRENIQAAYHLMSLFQSTRP